MMRIKDNSDGGTELCPFRFRILSLAASIQDFLVGMVLPG
jgi:hypothetical protein